MSTPIFQCMVSPKVWFLVFFI